MNACSLLPLFSAGWRGVLIFFSIAIAGPVKAAAPGAARRPVVVSDWSRICEMPDLGPLAGPVATKQQVVDHGFVRNSDGRWTLWACVRGTKVGRLLYGWEGDSLERGPWPPRGIVARAESRFGEKTTPEESIQAPFFVAEEGRYLCFYNSGGIRLMVSSDGRDFSRQLPGRENNLLYGDGGRDVMVLRDGGRYLAYSTVSTKEGRGYIVLRTSNDLRTWSTLRNVCEGGRGGVGPVSAESPFVVALDGWYYLFRASSNNGRTYVYRSAVPDYFGVNDDRGLIAELQVKAPEIIAHEGKFYISDLADFRGIKLARLEWQLDETAAR